jgi:hypothetical protein
MMGAREGSFNGLLSRMRLDRVPEAGIRDTDNPRKIGQRGERALQAHGAKNK